MSGVTLHCQVTYLGVEGRGGTLEQRLSVSKGDWGGHVCQHLHSLVSRLLEGL